jgi:hypothetical protein
MQIPDLVVEGAGAQSLSSQQGSSLGAWGVGALGGCGLTCGGAFHAQQTRRSWWQMENSCRLQRKILECESAAII